MIDRSWFFPFWCLNNHTDVSDQNAEVSVKQVSYDDRIQLAGI